MGVCRGRAKDEDVSDGKSYCIAVLIPDHPLLFTSRAGITTVSTVAVFRFTAVRGRSTSFHLTTDCVTKPVPVKVRNVSGSPTAACLGVTLLNVGCGIF